MPALLAIRPMEHLQRSFRTLESSTTRKAQAQAQARASITLHPGQSRFNNHTWKHHKASVHFALSLSPPPLHSDILRTPHACLQLLFVLSLTLASNRYLPCSFLQPHLRLRTTFKSHCRNPLVYSTPQKTSALPDHSEDCPDCSQFTQVSSIRLVLCSSAWCFPREKSKAITPVDFLLESISAIRTSISPTAILEPLQLLRWILASRSTILSSRFISVHIYETTTCCLHIRSHNSRR